MNYPSTPKLTRAASAVVILGLTTIGYGLPGFLVGLLVLLASIGLPSMYAFAVGQLAIAVLVTGDSALAQQSGAGAAAAASTGGILAALTTTIIGVELALLAVLWSDLPVCQPRSVPVAGLATGGFAVIAVLVFAQTEALWLTGGVVLASIVTVLYALHRYTLVFVLEADTT